MKCLRAVILVLCVGAFYFVPPWAGQAQQAQSGTPTIRVTSRLVFLDMTVLDKRGHPVVQGLTRDDFLITEDKRPQRIFSFEAPEVHSADVPGDSADETSRGKAPATIFLLDLLNSRFEDFAYIRYEVHKYLEREPEHLTSPSELMVLGNQSLQVVQGYTRNRSDLLAALDDIPAALPYKMMSASFLAERFGQSIDALQQIALQNKGVPGRKNVVWVGHGGPNIFTQGMPGSTADALNGYMHDTTNMLVDSRISLFVIYPGLRVNVASVPMSELSASADLGDDDPFTGDINFGVFVNETGGRRFFNRNDVDAEMRRAQELGSAYYTLTYQPARGPADGRFRRIRVTMRDPNLRVLTKAGYFAPDSHESMDPRQPSMIDLSEAAQSTLPFHTLTMTIDAVVRHPDTSSVQFVVVLHSKNINWQTDQNGKSKATLMLAVAGLSKDRRILSSRVETVTVMGGSQGGLRPAVEETRFPVTIRLPRSTEDVRVVAQSEDGGQIGSVELDRKALDRATAAPTPEPGLVTRGPSQQSAGKPTKQ